MADDTQTWTTPFGIYEQKGTANTTFTAHEGPPPIKMPLKKKYRGG